MPHEPTVIDAPLAGLHSFPALIRQLGESFIVRDVMIPRYRIVFVKPGDRPTATKIISERNFSVVPCSEDGRIFTAVFESTRSAGSPRVLTHEREIKVGDFIPDTTPLAEALELFGSREWYFTLRGNRIAGLVTYWAFNSQECHVQLYAALSQLEELSREALALDGCGLQDNRGLLLSEEVLAKAQERFEASRKELGGNRFVDELDFHHVQDALKKHAPWRQFLAERLGTAPSNNEYDRRYCFTKIRDPVMHGRIIFPTYRHFLKYIVLIANMMDLISYLRVYIEDHDRAHRHSPRRPIGHGRSATMSVPA